MERRPPPAPASARDDWWWIFDPRLSLRARAVLVTGGGALVFTLLVGSLAGALVRHAQERQLGANFETLAFQVADKLDRTIHARTHDLQLAATQAPFRDAAVSSAERRRVLEAVQDNSRDFAWIGFADAVGTVRAATGGILSGAEVKGRPWFILARERPYAADLKEFSALTRELNGPDDTRTPRYLDLALPINATDGQFLGVLGAHVNWDWAREVQLSVIPESARRERIGVTVYNAAGEVLLDSGGSGWSQPPEALAIADARKFRGHQIEAAAGGTVYVTGFARTRGYREFRGFGWLITVRQPLDLVLAPARELQRTIFAWGAVFSVIFSIGSWLAAARLSRRFRSLGLAADRIRGGDVLTVLPRPPGDSEVARLCGSLGDLVEELRKKTPGDDARPK